VYAQEVRGRLENGKNDYGDASFERPIEEVVHELQAECLDLAGWGFILWSRLKGLENRLAVATAKGHCDDS